MVKMVNAIVEHEWKDGEQEKVFNFIGNIVEMEKSARLPGGFRLRSINVLGNEKRAICNWDAPGVEELVNLVKRLDPSGTFKVSEAMRII